MKTSLFNLPPNKQQEISAVLEAVMHIAKPQMVILFGSYSKGGWVEDKYIENGTTYEYKSDYDILVVTEKESQIPLGLWKRIKKQIHKRHEIATPISMIFHGIDFLNRELEDGNYFFADIKKEGTMLFDSGKFQLAEAKEISAKQRADKARLYFDNWFEQANQFYETYEFNFQKGYLKLAIFQLHQSAERFYTAILLVFTDYKPKIHELDVLDREVGIADVRFRTVFPRKTAEEDRKFMHLKKAYIDSRYKLNYTVDKDDLEYLAERVAKLKELTELVCLDKIEQLTQGA